MYFFSLLHQLEHSGRSISKSCYLFNEFRVRGRRNKIYTDNEQFGHAKSSSATASASPSRQASFTDSIQACPLATPTPTIAKYRYADSSSSSGCGPSSNTRSSITVGNGYGSSGMGSYRTGAPLGALLEGGQRSMSGSLRRAGLETLSSGKEQSKGGL